MKKLLKGCNYEIHLDNQENDKFNGIAFLDRDGVVIKEKNYIKDPLEVELNIGIEKVINFLYERKYKIIIITNQSGISRGYFGWEEYLAVTQKMLNLLSNKDSCKVSSIYACGSKNENDCNWRKPGTGMIYKSWSEKLIREKDSILIGDKLSDIETGINSSIRNLFHVLTGHGEKEKEKVRKFILKSNYPISLNSQNEKNFSQPKNLVILLKNLNKIL